MPIEREEFEKGDDRRLSLAPGTNADVVLSFLVDNSDKAFTLAELHEATEVNKGSLGAVLSRLRDRGLVEHRGKYWAVEDDDRIASAAAEHASESDRLEDDDFDKTEWMKHAEDAEQEDGGR